MWPKLRVLLLLLALGAGWFWAFMTVSRGFAPTALQGESQPTKNVKSHFAALAMAQRKHWNLEQYYGDGIGPGTVDVVVEFTQTAPLSPNTIGLDGFVPKHVNIYSGENGVVSVFAVFTRKAPYTWPRTLDVGLGPDYSERADFDPRYSSDLIGFFRIESEARLEMHSPNGHFGWTVTKDKDLATSPTCLYRQDLYKDGEWIRSLCAISK